MGGESGKPGASEAASLVFRIATMGLSLASAIMTAASTQCVQGGTTVSYTDYNSFKYSALADLLSAVLQGVAIYLEVVKKEKAAKTVELIDKLLQALTSTSAALLFAVDDITSCGVGRQRSSSRLCTEAGRFCGQIRVSSAFSLAAAASVSVSVYARHAPQSVTLTRKDPSPVGEFPRHEHDASESTVTLTAPPRPPPGTQGKVKVEVCIEGTTTGPPPEMPRPCCAHGCQNHAATEPPSEMPRPFYAYGCQNYAATESPPEMPRPCCAHGHGCQNHDVAVNTVGLAEPAPCIQLQVHGSVPTGQTTQPHEIYSCEPQRLTLYRPF